MKSGMCDSSRVTIKSTLAPRDFLLFFPTKKNPPGRLIHNQSRFRYKIEFADRFKLFVTLRQLS
jgi:hypothetical protein